MIIQEHNTKLTATITRTTKEDHDPIRIYVACLAAYNNGILHGTWINANQDADAIQEAIWDMLKASPIENAEEWAIHDYEGFKGASIAAYEGIEQVAELAAFVGVHGTLGGAVLALYGNLDDARTAIEDHYAGEYTSLAEFAEELTAQREDIPDYLAYYIDYDKMGRDLDISGDVAFVEMGFEQVHIFWTW